jgi:integrase
LPYLPLQPIVLSHPYQIQATANPSVLLLFVVGLTHPPFKLKSGLSLISLSSNTLGYYLILLGLTSGTRFAELVGLTRKNFNLINNTITINKTWRYTKRHPEGFGPTKNEASNRTIKLDIETMNAFERLFETNMYGIVFYSLSQNTK